jgi:hypothetical protein
VHTSEGEKLAREWGKNISFVVSAYVDEQFLTIVRQERILFTIKQWLVNLDVIMFR